MLNFYRKRFVIMFVSESLDVNSRNHLTIGKVDVIDLANQYGTPLYVMDADFIQKSCLEFQRSIHQYYNGHGMVCYASKAFCCKEIYRMMNKLHMGVDVVSLGELYTALEAGFPADRICFHGNNKTQEELSYAVRNRVSRIIVDNAEELNLLNQIAGEQETNQKILLRIKPGIDAHTHNFIRTGQIDSKFGFALETGEAMQAAADALQADHLTLTGLHCHIGSQIFDIDPFVLAAEVMMEFMRDIKQKTGRQLTELNLGGGYGIQYLEHENPVDYADYMKLVSQVLKQKAHEYNLPVPFILLEPGRSIVGPAGITLYRVGSRKQIPNIRTYLSIDGGMTDNPRYALYQAKYEAVVANRARDPRNERITLAGKCCESGDLIGEEMLLQTAKAGDIVAVLATGAYNYSMASNYNRIPRPAVVMVQDGKSKVVVRRETLEDLIRNDI